MGTGELFNGYAVPVWENEKIVEMDGSSDCTQGSVYLMALSCALKTGLNDQSFVYFTTIKNSGKNYKPLKNICKSE